MLTVFDAFLAISEDLSCLTLMRYLTNQVGLRNQTKLKNIQKTVSLLSLCSVNDNHAMFLTLFTSENFVVITANGGRGSG